MKTAIFSGSFNPIHSGHIAIARYVLENTDTEELWFVVSPQNPLKSSSELWPEEIRFEMVRLAVENEPGMIASDYEFKLPRPSFTIQTLDKLKSDYPDREFRLIVGGDNLACINRWKDHERILNEYGLMVYPRPGSKLPETAGHPNVKVVNAPLLDISATDIREKLEKKESIEDLVPEAVEDYIIAHRLG